MSFYSISGLCPTKEMSGAGFVIKLWPAFRDAVKTVNRTQTDIEHAVETLGRSWLDSCGFDGIFDPDNCGFDKDKTKKPGPRARPAYLPNRDLRVTWGEWGPEHITVPGNACGLDIGHCFGHFHKALLPHNVDTWRQVQILLVVFCWFADDLALYLPEEQRSRQ